MAEAGINLSITGDAQGFTDAATQAAKTAETTARNIADAAKRQAEAEHRRYEDAMSDLRRSTQARINASNDVKRAEAAASKAASEANKKNTVESRAVAQAKAAEAAAARRAAEAAVQHQRTVDASARAARQAMRDSATEATRAAEAHLQAATALARAQAGARARGGAGGILPGAGGRGSGGGAGGAGGGGVGGAVGRIISGAARGGAGAGGGGGQSLGTLSEATGVVEGVISGGIVEAMKQAPQIWNLVKTYGVLVSRVVAGVAAVVGTGVAIGQAIGDPDGFQAAVKSFTDRLKKVGKALANPAKALEGVVGWLSDSNLMEAEAKKMGEKFKKYQSQLLLSTARDRGAEQGKTADQVGRDQQKGVESRAESVQRLIAEREQAIELQKIELETMKDRDEHARRLAEIEKAWVLERAAIQKSAAEAEFDLAQKGYDSAKALLDEMNAAAEKADLAAGASGSSEALEEIAGKRSGVESRFNASQTALENAAKALRQADDGVKAAGVAGQIIDKGQANQEAARAAGDADRAAEQARQSSVLKIREFWKDVGDTFNKGIENAKTATDQAAAKKTADEDLRIAELRARGKNKEADKIQRERDVQRTADDYRARTGADADVARAYAERMVTAKDPRTGRRIRGAGAQPDISGGPPKTGIDAVTYRLLNGGTVPGGMPPEPKPASEFRGLDALAELQKKNRRIRGAGAATTEGGGEGTGPATAAGNVIGNGVGGLAQMIIGQLSGINKKLENLSPAKQPVRR